MGNGVFCCHRNNLIEHSVKLDGILSPIEQNNENNKMVKNIKNKKSNSRLNTSFSTYTILFLKYFLVLIDSLLNMH